MVLESLTFMREYAQASKSPFMNVIYDKDPISEWVFGRVALMGEAAHPTTPHGSRRYTFPVHALILVFIYDLKLTGRQ